jgi:hypothetical protein
MLRILLFCFLGLNLNGQSLQLAWFTQNDHFNIIDSEMDGAGNIIVAGTFSGIVDFDHGPHLRIDTAVGISDLFIAKYDPYGNLKWVHSMGNNNPEKITAIDVDQAGNIFAVGEFTRNLDFDPGPGVFNLQVVGFADIFLWALAPDGSFRFAKAFGDRSLETANDIDVNSAGDIVISGFLWGNGDMDPGTGHYPFTTSGLSDIFVLKCFPSGSLHWVRTMGSTKQDQALNVKFSDGGDIYVQGFFSDSVDFNPDTNSAATYFLNSANGGDGFLLKLNNFGLFVRAVNSPIIPMNMELKDSRELYFSGYFSGSKDFDPSPNSSAVRNAVGNQTPQFIWKLDSTFSFDWAQIWGGALMGANSLELARDQSNGVVISGAFSDTIDLNPSSVILNYSPVGQSDLFLVHLDSIGQFLYGNTWGSSLADEPGSALVNPDGEIYLLGQFTNRMDMDPSPAIVDPAFSGGRESFMLKLTYCPESVTWDTIEACNDYTWLNGFNYRDNSSGDRYIMEGLNGCDSLIYLHLNMNFIDSTAGQLNDSTLRANEPFSFYQWLICNPDSTFSPIPGATQRLYYPDSSGSYAVILDDGKCIDTSDCLNFWKPISLNEQPLAAQISIYPNPSNGTLHLDVPQHWKGYTVQIRDVQSRLLWSQAYQTSKSVELRLPPAAGLYFLELNFQNERLSQRIIIKP